LCSSGATSPVGGYIQVSPISGNAPLNVNVLATVNSTNSCVGAIYLLNWGDGSNPVSIPVSANVCTQLSQSYQHTYTAGGTYQITLSAGAHQTGATVTVFGNASTGGTGTVATPTTTTVPNETFTATPTTGTAPLLVTFSGIVSGKDQGWCPTGCSDILVFGDGSQGAVPLPLTQTGSQNYSITHTYTNNGTYTATLYQGQAGSGRPTVGSATITVGGGAAATYNPPSLTPGVGGNPQVVALTFDYSLNTCNYTISWGDGSTENSPGGCTGSGIGSKTVNHTYTSAGARTIVLMRDGQTAQVGVSIVN
jgi:PKD repeat protein